MLRSGVEYHGVVIPAIFHMPKNIQQHIALAPYTTLGVGGNAEYFVEVSDEDALREATRWAEVSDIPVTILAGGSNVLVDDDGVKGLVLRPLFSGITYVEKEDSVLVTVGAGVVLDTLIAELVSKELWGLENLSGIPGTVGAVPIQNVGAYGVEAKDFVHSVYVYDPSVHAMQTLTREACAFGYRDSIFKRAEGKNYIILAVTIMVRRTPQPKLAYKDLQATFTQNDAPRIGDIREAVIAIRSKKFPDWRQVGTAGSFFKNPIIEQYVYKRLSETYPALPGYAVGNDRVKIALGWILDQVCNVRGYTEGNVGLYEAQALVLVCTKGIRAEEIQLFSEKIIEKVFEKTQIRIEREVTLLQ